MSEREKKIEAIHLGQAAEFRVASELLLRGYNPFLASLDKGIDIIMDNGLRIQVKATRIREGKREGRINLHIQRRKEGELYRIPNPLEGIDFIIVWLPDTDDFYIVPAHLVRGQVGITFNPDSKTSKWNHYKNAWSLLKGKDEGTLDKVLNTNNK